MSCKDLVVISKVRYLLSTRHGFHHCFTDACDWLYFVLINNTQLDPSCGRDGITGLHTG